MTEVSSPRDVSILIVAGHDSSGGAGVEVDRASALALGARVQACVTAFTIQGAGGLLELGARPASAWLSEALAALDGAPDALKFGLLPGPEHVAAAMHLGVVARERFGAAWPIVWDPVVGPSRGGRFLDEPGIQALRRGLRSLAPILTPNVPELAELAGCAEAALATDLEARAEAAAALIGLGARGVVAKGGHGRETPLVDLVLTPGEQVRRLSRPRMAGASLRGTGCRHATALAVELARGTPLEPAAERAGAFVADQIASAR